MCIFIYILIYVMYLFTFQIYSWLLTTVDAFLQGHQDMGSVLAISRDYLNLHKKLLNEFQVNGANR